MKKKVYFLPALVLTLVLVSGCMKRESPEITIKNFCNAILKHDKESLSKFAGNAYVDGLRNEMITGLAQSFQSTVGNGVTGDQSRRIAESVADSLRNVWMNDSDVFLCFETDNGKVTSIILIYFQGVPFAVEGAKEITLKIAEMIDPADYILAPENKNALIQHLNLDGDDLYIRTFENSNDTRIEKLSQNIIIGSVGVIRFSDKYDKDLSEWKKDFLLQAVREFENALGQFDLPR